VIGATLGLSLGSLVGTASAAGATIGLGTAGSYTVLAGTTVTNTGPSDVQGSLGVSPGTAVTGFPPGVVSNGAIHAADAAALDAQAAVGTAFDIAAARPSTNAISADLAGGSLIPGVYTGGALALNGALVLDGQGDPDAVFVFQAASTLVTGSSSSVSLVNGARACNVFWQVGSSATIGTNSQFVGTVLALTSISAQTNATVQGRLLARNGAVTLDSNTLTLPTSCAAVVTTTSAVPTPSTTATGAGGGTPTTASGAGGATPTTASIPATGSRSGDGLAIALIVLAAGVVTVGVARRSMRRH
jgi:type VI secretion system secreted protein VgrG